MSASNPNVRRWIVRYWGAAGGDTQLRGADGGSVHAASRRNAREIVASVIVWAPNQRFAKWNAREVIGWPHPSVEVSASVYRGGQ